LTENSRERVGNSSSDGVIEVKSPGIVTVGFHRAVTAANGMVPWKVPDLKSEIRFHA
jgi:hypothetical protein